MFEHPTKNYLSSEPAPAKIVRWLPAIVVFGVMGGFYVTLAWYAYHAGTQSVQETDLIVVEADKTPIKEKPVDAGGMQFPNQDKTIFDTFAGNSVQPPKVERVLPKPEEPVAPASAAPEPAGWINDTLHKSADETQNATPAKPEQVISPAPADDTAQKDQDVMVGVKKPTVAATAAIAPPKEFQVAQATPLQVTDDQTKSYVAKTPDNTEPSPVVVAAPKEDKKPPVKKEITADAAAPADDNGAKVQLGAYRSEKEAQDAWNVMQKKHADLLASQDPIIVKADLGAKGIYYRLRTGGFASAIEAKTLCDKLTAAGQACIIPTAK